MTKPTIPPPIGTCPYVLRKKMYQRPTYGHCSVLYMEKIKKWKHHYRGIVHKILMNSKERTTPINFVPMMEYLNGFTVQYHTFDPTEIGLPVEGTYEIVDGKEIHIYVANDVPRTRQRFTIAHEFAHILQRFDGEFLADMEAIADPEERALIIERVAEITASYYLAPLPLVKRAYLKLCDVCGSDSARVRVAENFGVSQTMMNICLSEYGLIKR